MEHAQQLRTWMQPSGVGSTLQAAATLLLEPLPVLLLLVLLAAHLYL
jgi:hypothetical protein